MRIKNHLNSNAIKILTNNENNGKLLLKYKISKKSIRITLIFVSNK